MAKVSPDGWRQLEATGAAARELQTLAQLAAGLGDDWNTRHLGILTSKPPECHSLLSGNPSMPTAEAVRSTVYRDPEVHQALRLKAAHSRRSMSDIVNGALRQALREDQEDLAAVRSRKKERALSYEEFLTKLKADGTL